MAAGAVTFTDRDAFGAAVDAPLLTEDFSGLANGQLASGTVAPTTGTTITLDQESDDTFVMDEALRLSIENTPSDFADQTRVVTFTLPSMTTAAGLDFGDIANNTLGVGNNSGTVVSTGSGFSFDLSDLTEDDEGQYLGFFGFTTETAFNTITFSSELNGNMNDDDFLADNLSFVAPTQVPVPAGFPLLLAGVTGLGFAARWRKS